jgi:GT2 family glycosyltransferase
LKNCIEYCEKLDYPNFEIIVVGSTDAVVTGYKVRWIKIDEVSQGPKKDAGVANARGEVCAFIDDDAFPRADWLRNAVKYLEDAGVGAVCGPGVALPDESTLEQASSAVWGSPFGSGPARHRYVPTKQFFVDGEAPGYNLFVRRSLMVKVGGIASSFRSGEDALLSEKIRREGKKIVYAPDVVVFHRRRPLFKPFLKQIITYGTHRGYFLRHLDSESKQGDPTFALPLVNAFLVVNAFALLFFGLPFWQFLSAVFLAIDFGVYFGCGFVSSLLISRSVLVAVLGMVAIPVTHLTYAFGYLRGLVIPELGEKPSY